MVEIKRLRAETLDSEGRVTSEETIEVTVGTRSTARSDIDLAQTVRDHITVINGVELREWTGTPEALEAMARVNPVSAALFGLCRREGRVNREGQLVHEWRRKTDGARITPAPEDDGTSR